MLIIGNSHVSLFQKGISCLSETVKVRWVGALIVDWFENNHPGANLILDEFSAESSWKILFIGNHDIHAMLRKSTTIGLDSAFNELKQKYQALFTNLNYDQKLIWGVSVQQTDNISIPPYNSQNILEISQLFYAQMIQWCLENGIKILNPLSDLYNSDGLLPTIYLEDDGLHLKQSYCDLFLRPLSELTGLDLSEKEIKYEIEFDQNKESQAFTSLVLNGLDLEGRTCLSKVDNLEDALTGYISEKIRSKGIEYHLDLQTDFISSGLLDSLDLIDMYSYISEFLGIKVDFDVNLRNYPSIEQLIPFVQSQITGPFYEDFVELCQLSWEENQSQIVDCINRIQKLPESKIKEFTQIVEASTKNSHQYGIIYLLLGIWGVGDKDKLFEKACDTKLRFPVDFNFNNSLEFVKSDQSFESEASDLNSILEQAQFLIDSNNYKEAYSNILNVINEWPYFSDAYYMKSICEYKEGNVLESQQSIQRSLRLYPNNIKAQKHYNVIFSETQNRTPNRLNLIPKDFLSGKIIFDFNCGNLSSCLAAIHAGAKEVVGLERDAEVYQFAKSKNLPYPNLQLILVDYNKYRFQEELDTILPFKADYSFCFGLYRESDLIQREALLKYIIGKTSKGIFFEGHGDTELDTLKHYQWLFETFNLEYKFLGYSGSGNTYPLFFLDVFNK